MVDQFWESFYPLQYWVGWQYCVGFAKKLNLAFVGWNVRVTQHFLAFVGLRCAAPNLRLTQNLRSIGLGGAFFVTQHIIYRFNDT
jgi:hypothetical protein